MSELSPYPNREHYSFPRNAIEQAREELKLYPEPPAFRRNIFGLQKMYARTACLGSMQKYAEFATGLHLSETGDDKSQHLINADFFSGTIAAVHINVAPRPLHIRRQVLQQNFLLGLDENASNDSIAENITEHMQEWSGGEEDNWHIFLEQQGNEFADIAMEVAAKPFEDKLKSEERELDFLIGFTYATNLVHQVAEYQTSAWPPL